MSLDPRNQKVENYRSGLREGRALPAACYRDPELFELEIERVLRPAWSAIARWDTLPNAGDYSTQNLYGEPLVIVRGEDEKLRVFSNVCRHRAHTVASDSGNAKSLVCPYHRWTYGLDGQLRGAPFMEDTKGFDRADCALPQMKTEIWQGFLMVSLEPEPEPFAENLAGLDARLESFPLDEMVTFAVLDFDSAWNWKVMVDNFMESYHHLGIHADTLQKTNPAKGTYAGEAVGPYSILENPGLGDSGSFLVAQVFPTLLFSVIDEVPFAVWYEMQIDRHDHFHLRIHAFAPRELAESEAAVQALSETLLNIHLEDIPACEAVQRGIASRLWEPGLLNGRENCLKQFHAYLADRLEAQVP
jgi:phenylpropionate dioxygenase-like ring-hydroxylating dioxygenase large terminal subunit